jgi:hypothetical protein
MRVWTRDKPIYPWSTMATGQTVIWQIGSETEARNIRRNVSQNGVRNGKSFRVKLDRAASTMRVTRIR